MACVQEAARALARKEQEDVRRAALKERKEEREAVRRPNAFSDR